MPDEIKDITEGVTRGFISSIADFFKKYVFKDLNIKYPKQTMKFVIFPKDTYWDVENYKNRPPDMGIFCKCHVTNISKHFNIKPVTAVLKKSRTYGSVWVGHENKIIEQFKMTTMDISFHVVKFFRKKGQNFKSDIIVYDQFNNKHIIKNVDFRFRQD